MLFTSHRTEGDNGYAATAKHIAELAAKQPGFLGMGSARNGLGMTVSYWDSLEAIKAWKENLDHRQAQRRAKNWYQSFRVRICRVEHEYGF